MRTRRQPSSKLTQDLAFDAGSDWQPLEQRHGHDEHHGDDHRGHDDDD